MAGHHRSNTESSPSNSKGMTGDGHFPVSVIVAGFCIMTIAYLICFCCCIVQFFIRRNRLNANGRQGRDVGIEGGVFKHKNDQLKQDLLRQFQNSLKRFRKSSSTRKPVAGHFSSPGSCPICFEEYSGDPAEILVGYIKPCGHYFHIDCIWAWLENKQSCPLCRKPAQLSEKDIKGISLRHISDVQGTKEKESPSSGSSQYKRKKSKEKVEVNTNNPAVDPATEASEGASVGDGLTTDPLGVDHRFVISVEVEDVPGDGNQAEATSSVSADNDSNNAETIDSHSSSGSSSIQNNTETRQHVEPQDNQTSSEGRQKSFSRNTHDNPAFVP